MRSGVIIAGAVIALMALSACDNGPSAVETRDQSADGAGATLAAAGKGVAGAVDAGAEKTALTANRRETVDAKITRLTSATAAILARARPNIS